MVQVMLGGITRLTDSGLSITEWKPILGVVPPLDDTGWAEAFLKYQQIPQFKLLKSSLTVEDFKLIYFWEWFHRLWGRLLGFFFVIPLVVFWRQGRLVGLKGLLLLLLALGGAQGVMGWVMVASGLQDLVYVSHLRLAAHFMLAVALLVPLVWTGLSLLNPSLAAPIDRRLSRFTFTLLAVLVVQLIWGAFMAGLKAALAAPTWPTINGQWVPHGLFDAGWWWNNPLAVHFVHRGLAYALTLALVAWWWSARNALPTLRHLVLGLVLMQVTLGVLATVQSVYAHQLLYFGVAHQLVALLLTLALVSALHAITRVRVIGLRDEPPLATNEGA